LNLLILIFEFVLLFHSELVDGLLPVDVASLEDGAWEVGAVG
jgi:hypothetical protein